MREPTRFGLPGAIPAPFTLGGRRTISVGAVLAAAYDPRVGKTELNDVEAKPRSKYEKMGSNG